MNHLTGPTPTLRAIRTAIVAALLLAAGASLALIAQELLADRAAADVHADIASVRIVVNKSDAGAVRVALQHQGGDGEWGERQHPQLNRLRPDAPPNRWFASSPLAVALPRPSGAMTEAPTPSQHRATEPVADQPATIQRALYCVVAHGHADDPFWHQVRGFLYPSADHLDARVRFHSSPDGAEQAAAVAQCSADGAVAIAATLANPAAVTEALIEAKRQGARIVTFNSGASHARRAGSELHIALDDLAAGRFIAARLNEQGVEGTVACLIHERQNVGLQQRCEGIAEQYGGAGVREIALPSADDPVAVEQAIRELLLADGEASVEVIVSLNAGTSAAVLKLVNAIEDEMGPVLEDKRLVPMGYSPERGQYRRAREQADRRNLDLTSVADAGETQGYFIVSALFYAAHFPLTPAYIEQPTVMLISPWTLSLSGIVAASPAEIAATALAYQSVIAAGAESQSAANAE